MTQRRFQLCTIEPTNDSTESNIPGRSGNLVLSRVDDTFHIHWTRSDGIPSQVLSANMQSPQPTPDVSWVAGEKFQIPCTQISLLQLTENPLGLNFFDTDERNHRYFTFDNSEFISMTEMIEQLITNGIAVPSPKKKYSFEFYTRSHRTAYPYIPPHIQLQIIQQMTLSDFWDLLHTFFKTLINYLDSSDTLPKDPKYPLPIAARAAHQRVIEEINAFSANFTRGSKIDESMWKSFFDEEGRIKDPKFMFNQIFLNGIENSLLPLALPFVFGVYPKDLSAEDRNRLDIELQTEFTALKEQTESITSKQINNDHKKTSAFRVIKHDVSRTDRHHYAFKAKDAKGLDIITILLKTYCVFNPPCTLR